MERHERAVAGVLVVLALALRLVFVLRTGDVPLYWDEVHYDSWGKLYAEAWRALPEPGLLVEKLRAAFESSIQKGEAYSALIGAVYAIGGARPVHVLAMQAVLDALSCLFLYGIARRLGGPAVGLVALALATFYEPSIFSAGRLQAETVACFLYLGALWAFLPGRSRHRDGRLLASGGLLAVAMLARPAFQFLFPLWLLLVPVVHRPRATRAALAFAIGFFLLIGPRLVLTHHLFGRPLWAGSDNPGVNAYAGIVPENVGWRTDGYGFAAPMRGELLAVMQEQGTSNPTPNDYGRAALRTWLRHPLPSLGVAMHKIYQAWVHPYNDSRRELLTTTARQAAVHRIILALAAVGMVIALRTPGVSLPVIVTILYVWATYLTVQIEVRYVFPALPLMLCCAAVAAVDLARGAVSRWRHGRMLGVAILAAIAVALGIWLHAFPVGRILDMTGHPSPLAAHRARLGVAVATMVTLAVLVAMLLRDQLRAVHAAIAVGMPLALGVLVMLVGGALARPWREWASTLRPADGSIRQEFALPAHLPRPLRAEVRFDATAVAGGSGDLVVTVNGSEARRFVAGPRRDDAVPAASYYDTLFAAQRRPQRPWRAWYAVPVPLELLAGGQTLRVEATVEGEADTAVTVFGDYPAADDLYDGPSPFSPARLPDTSIYRYIVTGDFRMRRQIPLPGGVRSAYWDEGRWSTTDLSEDPGRQYGRYRAFLVLEYPGRRVFVQ